MVLLPPSPGLGVYVVIFLPVCTIHFSSYLHNLPPLSTFRYRSMPGSQTLDSVLSAISLGYR